jgi:hypothetical protein
MCQLGKEGLRKGDEFRKRKGGQGIGIAYRLARGKGSRECKGHSRWLARLSAA